MLEALMEDVLNLVRREIGRAMNAQAHPRAGIVTSYDDKAHAVKLDLMPEKTPTGWVPLGSMHVGNGFGIAVGAGIGDQFMVGFHEGDLNSPFIMARMFSKEDKAPAVKSGEMILKHKSGTAHKFSADGTHTQTHATGGTVTWDKDGNHTTDNGGKAVATKAGSVATSAAKGIAMKAGKAIRQEAGKILLNTG